MNPGDICVVPLHSESPNTPNWTLDGAQALPAQSNTVTGASGTDVAEYEAGCITVTPLSPDMAADADLDDWTDRLESAGLL